MTINNNKHTKKLYNKKSIYPFYYNKKRFIII